MADISTHHQAELGHHVRQGIAWLAACAEGENTAALSYAAFELRFGIERLAVHYWRALLGRRPEERDLRDMESFKRIEKRIYELAGHQREIDGHFEFMRIVMNAMKIDIPLNTPQVGRLSSHWHECSALCHIAWPLASAVPDVRKTAFARLTEISHSLSDCVGSLGWPVLHDAAFSALRTRFVAGTASVEDVVAHIHKTGIWARAEFPDGRPSKFVGEAVPPTSIENSTQD